MTTYMSRRVVAVLAAGVLAAGLAACGGDDGGDGGGGPVSLRMTIWSANEDHLALFDEIAAEYIAANDGVTEITFDPLPFETYTTGLTTQIAGGNAPDLAWIFENSAPAGVRRLRLIFTEPSQTDGIARVFEVEVYGR